MLTGLKELALTPLVEDDRQHEEEIADMINVGLESSHVRYFESEFAEDGRAGRNAKASGSGRLRRVGMEFNEPNPRNVGKPFNDKGDDRIIRQRGDDALHQQELTEDLLIDCGICRHSGCRGRQHSRARNSDGAM